MSAIATIVKIPKTALDGLRAASVSKKNLLGRPRDTYKEYLLKYGEDVIEYEWSRYILGTLLLYLQEHNIDLMKSEFDELSSLLTQNRSVTTFILSHSHKQLYLNKLDVSINEGDLRNYFNEFNGANEPNVGKYMLDGMKVLQQSLEVLDENSVIVLSIG